MPQKRPRPAGISPDGAAGFRRAGQPSITRISAERQASEKRLRRQHLVEHVHPLGARVLFELVDQLDREHGLGDELDRLLSRFAALDPAILAALGGDRFPVSPVRVVESG